MISSVSFLRMTDLKCSALMNISAGHLKIMLLICSKQLNLNKASMTVLSLSMFFHEIILFKFVLMLFGFLDESVYPAVSFLITAPIMKFGRKWWVVTLFIL